MRPCRRHTKGNASSGRQDAPCDGMLLPLRAHRGKLSDRKPHGRSMPKVAPGTTFQKLRESSLGPSQIEMSMATKCISTCCCSNPTTEFATRRKLRFLGDIDAKGEKADVQALLDVLAVTFCLPCTIMQVGLCAFASKPQRV